MDDDNVPPIVEDVPLGDATQEGHGGNGGHGEDENPRGDDKTRHNPNPIDPNIGSRRGSRTISRDSDPDDYDDAPGQGAGETKENDDEDEEVQTQIGRASCRERC